MLSVIKVGVDAVAHQFPRRQPRALQERPRLVGQHADRLPASTAPRTTPSAVP